MCGILGIITRRNAESRLSQNDVIAMRDTMSARGPDDSGIFQRHNVVVAHRRLAIRDIAHGKQPWISPDGRFALVYNGEIYNDDSLRDELSRLGFHCRTRCDTEVLMNSWLAWGKSCVRKLRGMFAFGVVDLVENRWWLVRDRCGVKPLFYSRIGNDFVFASSIKAITRHPDFSAAPNLVSVRHYLSTLRLTMDDQTFFENVQCVRPAEIISCTDAEVVCEEYWSLDQPVIANQTYTEAVEELDGRLRESVALRLKSDVPVGMMLSGGVDSNTLASITHENNGKPITGRCGGGVDVELDESNSDFYHAKKYAERLKFDYDAVRVSKEQYRETWEQLIREYATPLSTPTDVIIHHVAGSLKQEVGVAIGGEGADEAFCGYTIPHWSGNDFERSNSLAGTLSLEADLARASLVKQYGRDRFYSPSDHYLLTNGLIPRNSQSSFFRASNWGAADSERSIERYYDRLFESQGDRPMAEKYARVLFRLNLESLLGRLDSATMAVGLEARVPYTDHLVVEQAFRLPQHFKIDVDPAESQPWRSSLELFQRGSLRSKRILRSVAGRWMPPEMAQRPKMSFPTPLPKWLGSDWKPWLAQKLKTSPFAQQLFQPAAIDDLQNLPATLAMWNWPLINVALWGDQWFV
jgi:asparagine synthase (glutamine-hydrolysing)